MKKLLLVLLLSTGLFASQEENNDNNTDDEKKRLAHENSDNEFSESEQTNKRAKGSKIILRTEKDIKDFLKTLEYPTEENESKTTHNHLLSTGLYASQEENNDDTFDRNFDPDFLIGDLNSNAAFPTDLMTLHDGSRELSYIQNASTGARDNEYSDYQNVPITDPINVRQSTVAIKQLDNKAHKYRDSHNTSQSEDSSDESESEYSGESESEDSSDETECSYKEHSDDQNSPITNPKNVQQSTVAIKQLDNKAHKYKDSHNTSQSEDSSDESEENYKESNTANKKYQCEKCNRSFIFPSLLKRHAQTHIEEKRLKCTECNYNCILSSDLKKHTQIHTGEKSYKCKYEGCNYRAKRPDYIAKHIKTIHIGKKLHICRYCNKAFSQTSNLSTHIKSKHTGEKPLKCTHEGCNQSFIYRSDFKKHAVIHTGEKNFKCMNEGCNYSANRLENLKRHKKTRHPEESDDSEHEEE